MHHRDPAMTTTPNTIAEYLHQLHAALRDADPALIQDALYDAEEYLRSELAERPGIGEAQLLAEVATSYGAPDEVAAIYTDREVQVELALRPPARVATRAPSAPAGAAPSAPHAAPASTPTAPPRTWYSHFFGVALEPHTYGALFYLLLSMPIGIFYFTWVVTGISLSAGLAVLIIGIPFMILFIGTVHALSLVEGRIIEALLGVRMPRRPTPPPAAAPLMERIKAVLSDPRTWSTMLYMALMLPFGVVYFSLLVTMLSLSLGLVAGSVLQLLQGATLITIEDVYYTLPTWTAPFFCVLGIVLFFATLHMTRGLGYMHAALAKSMLVKGAR
jgi:hypothetical protein